MVLGFRILARLHQKVLQEVYARVVEYEWSLWVLHYQTFQLIRRFEGIEDVRVTAALTLLQDRARERWEVRRAESSSAEGSPELTSWYIWPERRPLSGLDGLPCPVSQRTCPRVHPGPMVSSLDTLFGDRGIPTPARPEHRPFQRYGIVEPRRRWALTIYQVEYVTALAPPGHVELVYRRWYRMRIPVVISGPRSAL